MKSPEYWAKRSEGVGARQFRKADSFQERLDREYDRSIRLMNKDIEAFYDRFAVNNEVDIKAARKMLNANELKEFKMTLEEFTALAKDNADGRYTQILNNVYYKTRVSRLEALQVQVNHHIEMLASKQQKGMTGLLGDVYTDTYYRTLFELQKGTGIGGTFARIESEKLEKMLSTKWMGANYSQRIWGNRGKLINEVQTVLSRSFIRGDNVKRASRELAERMNVSRSNAQRLIQTETAFFAGQATADSYRESGIVNKYEILATLDGRTSEICRHKDGKVYPMTEMDVGTNYPPFHPRCRTTVVPYFDDEIDVGERIAVDSEGTTIYVSGDMTYKDWANKHIPKSAQPKETQQSTLAVSELNEPPPTGDSIRRFNPNASYHLDLPGLPEETLEVITETNRRIAMEGWKESREIMVAVDEKGKIISELKGSINKVIFDDNFDMMLRQAAPSTVVITHNHPKGTRINIHDMRNLAIYDAVSYIVAVGNDGGVSAVGSAKKYIDVIGFDQLFRKTAKNIYNKLEYGTEYAKMSVSEQKAYFEYLVMRTLINELGWEYVEDFTSSRTGNWGIR